MTKISCSASLNTTLTCGTYPLTQRERGGVAPRDTSLISHDAHGRGRLRISNNRSSWKFWDVSSEMGMGWGASQGQKLPKSHCLSIKWDIFSVMCEWVTYEGNVTLYKRTHLFNSGSSLNLHVRHDRASFKNLTCWGDGEQIGAQKKGDGKGEQKSWHAVLAFQLSIKKSFMFLINEPSYLVGGPQNQEHRRRCSVTVVGCAPLVSILESQFHNSRGNCDVLKTPKGLQTFNHQSTPKHRHVSRCQVLLCGLETSADPDSWPHKCLNGVTEWIDKSPKLIFILKAKRSFNISDDLVLKETHWFINFSKKYMKRYWVGSLSSACYSLCTFFDCSTWDA